MSTFQVIRGIAYYALLAWLLYQLSREPKNIPLRAITFLIAGWAIGFPFGLAASAGKAFLVGDAMISQLIQDLLSLFGEYSLVCFFLFTVYDASSARRRAWMQLPVPILVATVLIVSTLSTPVELRGVAAQVTSDALKKNFASTVPSIGAYYFFANVYTLYACGYAFLVTCRYVRQGKDRRLRQGMRLTALGLAGMSLGFATFVIANVFLWTGSSNRLPNTVLIVGSISVFIGIPLFLIGLGYRSAAMRLAAMRIWWRHRRIYHQLRPLWTVLHAEFPEDSLNRSPVAPWQDTLSLRGVHRRYYRRVIECRDGLVRISPYLAHIRENGHQNGITVSDLATQLSHALRAHAAGAHVPPRAMPVAMPKTQGLDADVDELIALSRALPTP